MPKKKKAAKKAKAKPAEPCWVVGCTSKPPCTKHPKEPPEGVVKT